MISNRQILEENRFMRKHKLSRRSFVKAKMRITNDEEADTLVRRQYRKGWEI